MLSAKGPPLFPATLFQNPPRETVHVTDANVILVMGTFGLLTFDKLVYANKIMWQS